MEQQKIEKMSNVIATKLAEIIDKETSEKQIDIEDVLNFIENADSNELYRMVDKIDSISSEVSDRIEKAIDEDSNVIRIKDIDEDIVNDISGLSESIFNNYFRNLGCCEQREKIKELIDSI